MLCRDVISKKNDPEKGAKKIGEKMLRPSTYFVLLQNINASLVLMGRKKIDFQSSSFLGKLVFFRSLLVAKLPMDDVDFLVATVQLDLRQQAKYEARKTVNLNGLLSKPYASGVT